MQNLQLREKDYYPQLNALRGIGVLSVFLFHSYKPKFGSGFLMKFAAFCYNNIYLSMDMFFALSAFIITHLAFKEMQLKGSFSFKNFIIRRVLRIWPVYFIILFLSFVVIKGIADHYNIPVALPPASWYIFFISNFYLEDHVFFLRQLWTISVEEQFYIIWGTCLLLFNKELKWIIFSIAIIGVVFCFCSAYLKRGVYFHSLNYVFDMMCGAYFAYLINNRSFIIKKIGTGSFVQSLIIYLFLPFFFLSYYFLNSQLSPVSQNFLDIIMRIIFILHHCVIFIDQMYNENSLFNLSKAKFLIYVGEIAYGVYCFHGLVLTTGFLLISRLNFQIAPFLAAVIMFAITLIIGTISYKYIEKPILRLKRRF